jgi:hypothetical protein
MLPHPISEPGPILTYLARVRNAAKDEETRYLADMADHTLAAVKAMLQTPEGRIFMDLLEKSTQLSLTPILSDERALAARNAQGFITSDLRRIMTDETERLLQRQDDAASAGRAVARTRPGRARTRG